MGGEIDKWNGDYGVVLLEEYYLESNLESAFVSEGAENAICSLPECTKTCISESIIKCATYINEQMTLFSLYGAT